MTGSSTELGSLTWPEVQARAAAGAVLLVPLGATEQHGPHLGLATDTTIAAALATGVAERAAAEEADVIVAPPLAYGSSGEHQGFAGTLSIGQAAFETVVVELVRSARETFGAVVLLSAHGGNAEPLRRALATLVAESPTVLAVEPRWQPDDSAVDLHAGRTETSLALAIGDGVAHPDRGEVGAVDLGADAWQRMRAGGVGAVSANGVLGDPTGASDSEGRVLIDRAVGRLTAQVLGWLRSLKTDAGGESVQSVSENAVSSRWRSS